MKECAFYASIMIVVWKNVASYLNKRDLYSLSLVCKDSFSGCRLALREWLQSIDPEVFKQILQRYLERPLTTKVLSFLSFLSSHAKKAHLVNATCRILLTIPTIPLATSVAMFSLCDKPDLIAKTILSCYRRLRCSDKELAEALSWMLSYHVSLNMEPICIIDVLFGLFRRGYLLSIYFFVLLDTQAYKVVSTATRFMLPFLVPLEIPHGIRDARVEFVDAMVSWNGQTAYIQHNAPLLANEVFARCADVPIESGMHLVRQLIISSAITVKQSIELLPHIHVTNEDFGAFCVEDKVIFEFFLGQYPSRQYLSAASASNKIDPCKFKQIVDIVGYSDHDVEVAIQHQNHSAVSTFVRMGVPTAEDPELTRQVFCTGNWDLICTWMLLWHTFPDTYTADLSAAVDRWATYTTSHTPKRVLIHAINLGFNIQENNHHILRTLCLAHSYLARNVASRLLTVYPYTQKTPAQKTALAEIYKNIPIRSLKTRKAIISYLATPS